MRDIIYSFINKYEGKWESIYNAIASKEKENNLISAPSNAMFISDDDYLDKFKTMYMPPFAVFMSGKKELFFKKIFGILGKISMSMLEELKLMHKNDYVICVLDSNIDDKTRNYFLNNGLNLIIIKESKLQNEYKHPGLLYISEYDTNNINKSQSQSVERILYNLSNSVYIKSDIEKDAKVLFNNYKNSKKDCFLIVDTKITNTVKELIDQGVLKKINNINDVFKPMTN